MALSRAIQVAGQDVEGILNGTDQAARARSRRLSLPGNLTFGYDDAEVSNEGRKELEKIAEALKQISRSRISRSPPFLIEGHSRIRPARRNTISGSASAARNP